MAVPMGVSYAEFKAPSRPESDDEDDRGASGNRRTAARFGALLRGNAEALCGMRAGSFCGYDPFANEPADAYDKDFWEVTGVGEGQVGLLLRKGMKPSAALDAIIPKKADWMLDCAGWAQTCCALSHKDLIGARDFDSKFPGPFWISQFQSVPVLQGSSFHRAEKGDEFVRQLRGGRFTRETYTEQELLDASPAGTLFMFTNDDLTEGHPYHFEHSLKLDVDLFAALGLAAGKCLLTQKELRESLAAKSFAGVATGEALPDYADRVAWIWSVRFLNYGLLD
jgi:hypothetical protein